LYYLFFYCGAVIHIKEWAYAGVALFFITAIIAHMAHKDPIIITFVNIFLIVILILSNMYLHKIKDFGATLY